MPGNPYLSQPAISGSVSGMTTGGSMGGPWGAAIGGIAGGLLGAKSSKDSDSAGDAMSDQERKAQEDLAFRQRVFAQESGLTYPQRQRLQAMAMSDRPLYYDQSAAQINRQYASGDRQANYLGYGTNLNFGQDTSRLQANALQRRQALAGAYQTGLTNRTNLLTTSAGMGAPLQAAGQQLGAGYSNMANMYGVWANQANMAQAQQAQNYGQMFGGLAELYGYNKKVNAPASTFTPNPGGTGGTGGNIGTPASTPYGHPYN